jgi:parallel beta-helix repeat protein
MPDYCVSVHAVSDIRLTNLDVAGCGMGAIHLQQTHRVTLEGSRIHDNAMHGWTSPVNLWQCASGNVIRGNWIWANRAAAPGYPDTEGHGIIMDYCEAAGGALIENNVVWDNQGWCILVYHSDGATLRNNTCYHNGVRADSGEVNVLGNHAVVHNNILVPRPGQLALALRYTESQYAVDPATLQEDFNLLGGQATERVAAWGGVTGTFAQYQARNPRGWSTASWQADPLFNNAAARDLHLTARSPARGLGDLQDAPARDIEQHVRPDGVIDCGAYQFMPSVDD